MTYSNTKVKGHERVSKNGRTHTVKPHNRKYEMGAALGEMFKEVTPKKASRAAVAVSAWGLVWSGLSTMMSIGSAAVYAVLVVCLGIITWAVMTKADRRQTRRELRSRAATSLKRRMRLLTHRTVKAPQKKPPLRAKKVAKKAAPKRNAQTAHMTCMSCFRSYEGIVTKKRICGRCIGVAENKATLKKRAAQFDTLKPSGDGKKCQPCSGKGVLRLARSIGAESRYDFMQGDHTYRWCSKCGGAGTV